MKIENYINGKLVPPNAGQYIDNINPAIGEVYGQIPDSDETDIEEAVKAGQQAFPDWSTCGVETRSKILLKIADLIETNLNELAEAESIDNGKPLALAKSVDIPRAASNFRFFGTGILHFASESHYTEANAINYTLRLPIGVVGCISPWNLPLYLFTWKIAPALAAGNCVVAKPSEITPMTAYLFSKICMEAGLPSGVLNIVHGYGQKVGQAIVEHPTIKAVSFTGGTETGKQIARTAGPMFKKLSLELGGKNPTIIFSDCDFDNMLETTVKSSFANQGQICLCGSRIFIEQSIYKKFKEAFVEKVKSLKVGDPKEASSNLGAIVSQSHLEKILGFIEEGEKEGGTILTGGNQIHLTGRCENGYFMEPAVFEGLDPTCKMNQEEIFGPVVTLVPFESEEQVIEYANGTPYGLACSIWTQDITRANRMATQIESGIVWINCWMLRDLRTPFGGIKNSGIGREGGWEALRFFTEAKNVCVKM